MRGIWQTLDEGRLLSSAIATSWLLIWVITKQQRENCFTYTCMHITLLGGGGVYLLNKVVTGVGGGVWRGWRRRRRCCSHLRFYNLPPPNKITPKFFGRTVLFHSWSSLKYYYDDHCLGLVWTMRRGLVCFGIWLGGIVAEELLIQGLSCIKNHPNMSFGEMEDY